MILFFFIICVVACLGCIYIAIDNYKIIRSIKKKRKNGKKLQQERGRKKQNEYMKRRLEEGKKEREKNC